MSPRAKRGRWLRYTADRRSLAFAFVHLAIMITTYVLAPRGLLAAAVVPLLAFSAFVQLISTHNAMHSPIFFDRGKNRLWQVVLSLTFTYPVSVMVPVHNLSHHLHLQTAKDVLRTTDVRHRSNLVNLLHHVLVGTAHVHALNAAYFVSMRKKRAAWFKQASLETGVVLAVAGALAVLDVRAFLMFVLLPSLLGQSMIIGLGYLQHDGCDPDSDHDHSRNFVGPLLNFLLFENGYHTIHHDKPGLHWSLSREAHERLVVPHIAPALNERSILAYIFRVCVLPNRRLRYDGRPVQFDLADQPERRQIWIPDGAAAVGASSGAVEG